MRNSDYGLETGVAFSLIAPEPFPRASSGECHRGDANQRQPLRPMICKPVPETQPPACRIIPRPSFPSLITAVDSGPAEATVEVTLPRNSGHLW